MPPGQQTSRTYKKIWLYLIGKIRYQELIIQQSIYVNPWTNLNIYLNLYLCVCECGGGYTVCVDAYIGQKRAGTRVLKLEIEVIVSHWVWCCGQNSGAMVKKQALLTSEPENLIKLLLKKLRNSGNNNHFLKKNINKALKWKNTLSRIKYVRREINFRIYQAK